MATAYGEWAEQYDTDLIDEMGYVAPAIASQLLQGYLEDQTAKILGAGCGTLCPQVPGLTISETIQW